MESYASGLIGTKAQFCIYLGNIFCITKVKLISKLAPTQIYNLFAANI